MTRLFIIPRMFEFACSAIYAKYAKCAKCAMCEVGAGTREQRASREQRSGYPSLTPAEYQPQGLLQSLQLSSKPVFTFPSLDPVNGLPPPRSLFFIWLLAWPPLKGFPPSSSSGKMNQCCCYRCCRVRETSRVYANGALGHCSYR